ncbi:unnamed protein product [Rhizophagus irregularis]|nr:unnamed protein product [Rhizophagus irregularis]
MLQPQAIGLFKESHEPVLILADFRCSLCAGNNWNFCGLALPFRLLRLMEAIKAEQPIVKFQDDLFTLVQSIYIRLNENQVLEANINTSNKVDEAIEFWREVFADGIWKNICNCCINLNYDNLKGYIKQLA